MRAHRASLRRRLTGLCVLLTLMALAVAGLDSWSRERHRLEQAMRQNLTTLGRMVAVNVQSGLTFADPKDVTNFLQTVVDTMHLQAAAVFTADGQRFAVAGDTGRWPTTAAPPARDGADFLGVECFDYTNDELASCQGHVVIRADGSTLRERLGEFAASLGLTIALAMTGLGLAAHWLLGHLLRPVAALVETTQRVRTTEDYSLRARATADDEIGALVHSFNAMLDVIQERDTNLAKGAERLEQQVRERTAELRRALDAAEAATRAKSTFVANMSHEIRTPLNAVLGMADLAMETEDPVELREYLNVIRSAGANLLGILCDILDLSKIESGKLELSPVPTDLEALVLEALRPLTSRIQSKNLELVCDVAGDLSPGYLCDDVRLRQVLTNLVGNAIKFTERGHVLVRVGLAGTQRSGHDVYITVQDSGVGIPADRLTAIFTPFTQADNTITRRFAGTGLGLSITDRLVRLMGGRIEVESTLGVGTTFRVTLPLEPCTSPLEAPPAPPAGWRLLLASPSRPLQQALATVAARLGTTLAAVDSLDHLAGQAIGPTDLVLIDDRDPDHDAQLQAMIPPRADGLRPVLLLSAYQDLASTTARVQQHGFAGYLTKPVAFREIALRLAAAARPLASATPAAKVPGRPSQAPGNDGRLRILVAEDNPVNQKLIERILHKEGHSVTIAENGRACVTAHAHGEFDLVLMDMQMPEMSGLEATVRIRESESQGTTRLPIIALTANTSVEDREACMRAGMDDVLPKPVSIPRLRALLAQFAKPDLEPRNGATGAQEGPA